MCGEFGNSEIEFICGLFNVEGRSDASKFDASKLDYIHLNNSMRLIDTVCSYFKRKYADHTDIPETQLKECLGNFYLAVLNMDESEINEEFLRNLHLTVFPPELGEFFGIAKVEALRGLAVVIVVATLLQRHGFFEGSVIPNSSSNLGSNPPTEHVYDRASIGAGFTSWLAEYDPDHLIENSSEEYGRLARFYHVCTIIFNIYHTGKNLKGMYIFVGACLEGIPDEVERLYSLGSERKELTKRRESIFTKITGVKQRKRTAKPKDSNPGQKSKSRRTESFSSDDIQDGKSSTTLQHESSDEEEDDDDDDDDTDKTEEPQFESSSYDGQATHSNMKRKKTTNEQITEQEFTFHPHDCAKNIAELID